MTQKQMLGVVVGVGVVLLLCAVVYKQFTAGVQQPKTSGTMMQKTDSMMQKKTMEQKAAVPDTIDGITESIAGEADADATALDDESQGEDAELNADSDSVNSLENSYDPNNL